MKRRLFGLSFLLFVLDCRSTKLFLLFSGHLPAQFSNWLFLAFLKFPIQLACFIDVLADSSLPIVQLNYYELIQTKLRNFARR